MKLKWYFSLYFLFIYSMSMAQSEANKIEIEERISTKDVPSIPKEKIADLFGNENKIKWYLEKNNSFQNFEAKLVREKRRYSIEFDTLFNIKDIEVENEFDELPGETQLGLTNYFDDNYTSYKVTRIQLQVSGEFNKLIEYIKSGNHDDLLIRYEIEFVGKEDKSSLYYEGLFGNSGSLIKRRHIILNTSDNISY